jgi:hypothetical protein
VHVIVPAALAAITELQHTGPIVGHRLVVVAGVLDDIERIEREDDDNGQDGYEDAEDTAFWSIVRASFNDACGICGYWTCRCVSGASVPAPGGADVLVPVGGSGQCQVCGHRFPDWDGGVCDACKAVGG